MRYSDARSTLKTGDMVLYSADPAVFDKFDPHEVRHDLETHLVRLGTSSQWTHVGIIWVAEDLDRVMVMDMTGYGCAPRPLSDDLKDGPVFIVPAPRALTPAGLAYAASKWGKLEYSRMKALLSKIGRWLPFIKLKDDKSTCANFVRSVYGFDGISPAEEETPYALMMGALLRWGSTLIPVVSDE